MRSHASRLTWSLSTWIVLGVAAVFLVHSEKHIDELRSAMRAFEDRARRATEWIERARSAQAAYVAAGQSVADWAPQVDRALREASAETDGLRAAAGSMEAQTELLTAAATLLRFKQLDERIHEYARDGQTLMAADILFSESRETADEASRQLDTARTVERDRLAGAEASSRRLQGLASGASALLAMLVVGLLAWTSPNPDPLAEPDEVQSSAASDGSLGLREAVDVASSNLSTAADLCAALARSGNPEELELQLGRVAKALDAGGIVVWLGSGAGADLRPVLASGYSPNIVARLPTVAVSADNAVAAAYRTGVLQIVRSRPGAPGAVAAPVFSPEGCVGAFTAEIQNELEMSGRVQMLATLVAAQLGPALTAWPCQLAPQTPQDEAHNLADTPKTATA